MLSGFGSIPKRQMRKVEENEQIDKGMEIYSSLKGGRLYRQNEKLWYRLEPSGEWALLLGHTKLVQENGRCYLYRSHRRNWKVEVKCLLRKTAE
jgi:hypothetical protein